MAEAKSSREWLRNLVSIESDQTLSCDAYLYIKDVLAELDRAERLASRFRSEAHSWITKAMMDSPETIIETRKRCEAAADAIVARILDAIEEDYGKGGNT